MRNFFLKLCFLTIVLINPAHAQDSDWVEGDHFRARLAAVPEGANTSAVLEFEFEDGWHSYGDPPGDAGLPPRFNWDESQNLETVEIDWPATKEKREFDMFTVNAYEGAVNFPLTIQPKNTAQDVSLNLDLKIMVCKDICIPAQAKLALNLGAGSANDD